MAGLCTSDGRTMVDAARRPPKRIETESGLGPSAAALPDEPGDAVPTSPTLVADSVIAPPLRERMQEAAPEVPIGIVIEVRHDDRGGAGDARAHVRLLVERIAGSETATWEFGSYVATELTADHIRALVRSDIEEAHEPTTREGEGWSPRRSIHRIWPNFTVTALTHRSAITTKAQAAHRSFNALGQGIVWAVLDSGIQADHPHFREHGNVPSSLPHRSFLAGTTDADALEDASGHGTHVAGIMAGAQTAGDPAKRIVAATVYQDDDGEQQASELHLQAISGMAPQCRLLSCKVLHDDRTGDVAAVLAALHHIQEVNSNGRALQIHGVNLSVGYPFDPSWFAAGLTPVCREVDRLVRSGVVVVVAAGNTGYGYALDAQERRMRLGFDLTINDPGNADLAITVGSTSARPHTTGISYFSSKGPTGDGRMKPDLVAPGERVVSAGWGETLERGRNGVPDATYVEDSGTSMAAPHVSGVAAAFMSVHNEFIGRPEDVKRVLMSTATDLGRQPTFQGRGLVDAMRAIQSV